MYEEIFTKYVSAYDMSDSDIKLKYNHSIRVMKLSEKYAKALNFNEEDTELAKIIGLLHDIGRFEQLRVYHTYNDAISIDHADYGVRELFEKNIIEQFNIKKEWYPIIKFAIQNHNKSEIEPCNDERTLMHAKLIRDTDKIDILYFLGTLGELNNKGVNEPITNEVKEVFYKHQTINHKFIKRTNDKYIQYFAFIYDINYDVCLKEFLDNLKVYYNRVEINNIFKEYLEETIKYVNERIDNK